MNCSKLKESLEGVAEQAVKLVGDIIQSQKERPIEDTEKDSIRRSITDLIREDHPIRSLLGKLRKYTFENSSRVMNNQKLTNFLHDFSFCSEENR